MSKAKKIQLLQTQMPYESFLKVKQYQLKITAFKGGWIGPFQRECVLRQPAVVVLPYDPLRDQIVLIEQFRAGCVETKPVPWMLECVAGLIEHGLTPEQTAHKELQEEAGLKAESLHLLHHYWASPGASNEAVYLYLAQIDASCVKTHGVFGVPEEHEDIQIHLVPSKEAFRMVEAGQIDNAATLLALQSLALKLLKNKKIF